MYSVGGEGCRGDDVRDVTGRPRKQDSRRAAHGDLVGADVASSSAVRRTRGLQGSCLLSCFYIGSFYTFLKYQQPLAV